MLNGERLEKGGKAKMVSGDSFKVAACPTVFTLSRQRRQAGVTHRLVLVSLFPASTCPSPLSTCTLGTCMTMFWHEADACSPTAVDPAREEQRGRRGSHRAAAAATADRSPPRSDTGGGDGHDRSQSPERVIRRHSPHRSDGGVGSNGRSRERSLERLPRRRSPPRSGSGAGGNGRIRERSRSLERLPRRRSQPRNNDAGADAGGGRSRDRSCSPERLPRRSSQPHSAAADGDAGGGRNCDRSCSAKRLPERRSRSRSAERRIAERRSRDRNPQRDAQLRRPERMPRDMGGLRHPRSGLSRPRSPPPRRSSPARHLHTYAPVDAASGLFCQCMSSRLIVIPRFPDKNRRTLHKQPGWRQLHSCTKAIMPVRGRARSACDRHTSTQVLLMHRGSNGRRSPSLAERQHGRKRSRSPARYADPNPYPAATSAMPMVPVHLTLSALSALCTLRLQRASEVSWVVFYSWVQAREGRARRVCGR